MLPKRIPLRWNEDPQRSSVEANQQRVRTVTNPTNPENEQAPDEQAAGAGAASQPEAPGYAPPVPPAPPAPPAQPQYAQPQYAHPQYAPPPAAYPPAQQYPSQPQYAYPAAGYGVPGPGEPFDGAADPDDLTRPLYGATFGQSIRRFFRAYTKFHGRASRSEYWWVTLFLSLCSLVPAILYTIGLITIGVSSASYDGYSYSMGNGAATGTGIAMIVIGGFLLFGIFCATIVPSLAIAWRRLHDSNLAGPLYFLSFIPYVGGLIVLVFMLLSPKPEGRRFDR